MKGALYNIDEIGIGTLYWHNFGNNRLVLTSGIMP